MRSAVPLRPRGTALRLLLQDWLRVSCWAWCVLSVVVLTMTSASALLTERGPSAEGVMPSYDTWARGYCLVIGTHLAWHSLPLYVSNSMTRRAFTRQAATFAVLITGFVATLFTLSLALEVSAYAVLDEEHDWGLDSLPPYLLESWLAFLVWLVAGALAAACVYRFSTKGLLVIPFAALLVFPGDIILGRGFTVFGLGPAFSGGLAPVRAALALLGLLAAGSLLTWLVVRDTPIRPPTR